MALDASRSETEAALTRQREFVADASHELRTPLTSVLSNLRAAPVDACRARTRRSPSPRCARRGACAGWSPTCCCSPAPTPAASATRQSVDLRQVVRDAAGEAMPLADDHDLSVSLADGDCAAADRARRRPTTCTGWS